MKIGVLSDTHLTELTPAFEKILSQYFSDIDLLLHAGDFVGYEIYSYLQQYDIFAVAGNMDNPSLQRILPAKNVITIGGKRIGLIHGWGIGNPFESKLISQFNDVDVIVFGHTHIPVNKKSDKGILLFNPGSLKGDNTKFSPSIGILEIENKSGIRGELIFLTD